MEPRPSGQRAGKSCSPCPVWASYALWWPSMLPYWSRHFPYEILNFSSHRTADADRRQSISRSLHGTASETFWAGTSYLLTSATFQPMIAAVSDVFGRRELLCLSVVLFTAGSLISCLAQDFPTLLVGRTLKGIGGGGIITLNLVIISMCDSSIYFPL